MEEHGDESDSTSQGVENSADDSSSSEAIVQNMAIAHELAIDADFKLNEVPSDSIQAKVKRVVHQAFWDVLQEDINKDPPNYKQAIKLLAEIKEILVSLTFEHNSSLREQINSILDVDLIRQQSEHGNVDIPGYANFIIQTMSKICVPARDEDIRKLSMVDGGLVAMFREIFEVLNKMKLDMANYKLSVLRPQILQQSVEYERQKFKEYLNTNPNALLSTINWIQKGYDIAREEINRVTDGTSGVDGVNSEHSETSGSSNDHRGPTSVESVEVFRHCYIGILLGEGGFPFPETLCMDGYRIADIRMSCQYLIKVAAVVAVTLNIVGKHLATDAEYKKTIKETVAILLKGLRESDLSSVFPNICEQVIKDTSSFLSRRDLNGLDEQKSTLLRNQLMNLSDDGNNICLLIKKRIYKFLMNNLLQPSSSNSAPAVPPALADIEYEVVDVIKKFGPIVTHNFAVFQPFYDEIFKENLS